MRVGGVPAAPVLVALAPVVHQQVRVPGVDPGEPLVGEAPSASVPGELHHGREGFAHPGGAAEPPPHRIAREPAERHVPGLGQPQPVVHRVGGDQDVARAGRLAQRALPERVEVRGFGDVRTVALQVGRGQVERGHAAPRRLGRAAPPIVAGGPQEISVDGNRSRRGSTAVRSGLPCGRDVGKRLLRTTH